MSVSRPTNIRHAFFILAGAAALVLTWPHAFQWMAPGGNTSTRSLSSAMR